MVNTTKTYPGVDIVSGDNTVVATVKINLKRLKNKEHVEHFNMAMLRD